MNPGTILRRLTKRTPIHSAHRIRCSFCGRHQDQVAALVSGPGVYICDQCVQTAVRIIAESDRDEPESPSP